MNLWLYTKKFNILSINLLNKVASDGHSPGLETGDPLFFRDRGGRVLLSLDFIGG